MAECCSFIAGVADCSVESNLGSQLCAAFLQRFRER